MYKMKDNLKLQKSIERSKKLVSKMVKKEDKDLLIPLKKLNMEICLVVAGFKCECCKSKKELQIHHLIPRKAKNFTNFWRYVSQRYYWSNQIILCYDCHKKYHDIVNNPPFVQSITKEKIKKIKKKYGVL